MTRWSIRRSQETTAVAAGTRYFIVSLLYLLMLPQASAAQMQTPFLDAIAFDSIDAVGSTKVQIRGLDTLAVYSQRSDVTQTSGGTISSVAAGSGQQQAQEPRWSLTAGAGVDYSADAEPPMRGRIVYQFGTSGVRGLHIVRPDGTADVQVTPLSGSGFINNRLPPTPYPCVDARDPSWSPDGRYIVYACLEVEDQNNPTLPTSYDLWIHDTGSDPDTTADDTDYPLLVLTGALALKPAWSPDGDSIAFVTNLGGQAAKGRNAKIGLIGVSITGVTVGVTQAPQILTDDSYNNGAPTWSPDSNFIAFSSTRPGASKTGNHTIWRLNIYDKSLIQITTGSGTANDTNPSWSPAGLIAFQSDRSNGNHIFVIDSLHPEISGGHVYQTSGCHTNCSVTDGNEQNPDWQPGFIGIDLDERAGTNRDWNSLRARGVEAALIETKARGSGVPVGNVPPPGTDCDFTEPAWCFNRMRSTSCEALSQRDC